MQPRVLFAAFVLFAAVSGGLWSLVVWRDLRQTVERGAMAAEAMAQLMQANAAHAIEAGDALTLALQAEIAEWDLKDEQVGHRMLQQLRRQMAATPQVSSFWVLDANGDNMLENWGLPPRVRGNFAERGYFLAHRGPERGLFIEAADLGTVSHQRRFTLSRAVRDRNGRLKAVVVVGIYSHPFAQVFQDAGLGFQGRYCLVTQDGKLLAQWPEGATTYQPERVKDILERLAAGKTHLVEQDDLLHGASIIAARRLERLPVAVITRVPGEEVLESWWPRTLYSAAATVAAVLGFSLLVLIGLRIARSEAEARRQLEAVNRDLDQRVRDRTDELEQAARRAENADRAKGKFLATISHDLRQPLQGMAMFTQLAIRALDDPKLRRLGDMAMASLYAGSRLLDDLVDLAQLESGVARVESRPVALWPLLTRLVADARPAAQAKALELRLVAPDLQVLSDSVRLQQIVQNLLSNAIKYTASGKILVGCRRCGGAVRIELWDTGPGIPPEHLQMIFEEFYQVDNPARNSSQGVGLGLAIVDRTARLLGHPLTVTSVVAKGSMFSVTVPLLPEPEMHRVLEAAEGQG